MLTLALVRSSSIMAIALLSLIFCRSSEIQGHMVHVVQFAKQSASYVLAFRVSSNTHICLLSLFIKLQTLIDVGRCW